MRIAGASQFLNQATLANKQGSTFVGDSVLSLSAPASLLDVGRNNQVSGIGISARARALNNQLIEQNQGTYNQLFSLAGGASATVEAAQIQIAGLAATAITSRDISIQDDGSFASSPLGTTVDEEV